MPEVRFEVGDVTSLAVESRRAGGWVLIVRDIDGDDLVAATMSAEELRETARVLLEAAGSS